MLNLSDVAKNVRIKLNSQFLTKSISEEFLLLSDKVYISQDSVYKDSAGYYVMLKSSAPHFGIGFAYLHQIDIYE